MASSDYKRVSRKRACRICCKTDWCSYTPDEKISFCAREINGSDRTSRTGWGVFYHEKTLFPDYIEPPFAPRRDKAQPKPELAPLKIRDFVYRKLIALAPATDSFEIINGEKGLRARRILDFENYGALPRTQSERRDLAEEIRRLINQKFSDYVRRQKSSVSGLPGFWLDKTGRIRLWQAKDYACPMMLIPYRSPDGLVQACQIRFMCRKPKTVRYVWLSTTDKEESVGCGSPLHFAARRNAGFDRPLLITEGALKAETVGTLKTNWDVLASAGVACSHEEIVAAARLRPIFLAFDADYYENPHVARATARLLDSLLSDSAKSKSPPRIKILTWDRKFKGVDDALLRRVAMSAAAPSEWFKSLSAACQIEVAGILPVFDEKFIG